MLEPDEEERLPALPLDLLSSPAVRDEIAQAPTSVIAHDSTDNHVSQDSIAPSDELMGLDTELAPLPDPATWDTSVAKRASIRLVKRPAAESLSDDLPIVEDIKEDEHEAHEEAQTTPAQPAPEPVKTANAETNSIGIQQEAREEKDAAPPRPPTTNGTAKPPQTAPTRPAAAKAKATTAKTAKTSGKKKGKKNDDDMHGGRCAKCVIM